MISFTGSTRAGIAISRAAADGLKKVALELGGKGANLVFADADEKAVMRGARHVFYNSGQSCNAPTRMLVQREIYDRAVETAREVAEKTAVASAHEPGRHIGPVVSKRQWDQIQGLIEKGIAEGAVWLPVAPACRRRQSWLFRAAHGVCRRDQRHDHRPDQVFEPVLSIIPFDDEEDAIRIANDTAYGLTNYVQKPGRRPPQPAGAPPAVGHGGNERRKPWPRCLLRWHRPVGPRPQGGVWGIEEFVDSKAISGWDGQSLIAV